jgi:hypothetical protein
VGRPSANATGLDLTRQIVWIAGVGAYVVRWQRMSERKEGDEEEMDEDYLEVRGDWKGWAASRRGLWD